MYTWKSKPHVYTIKAIHKIKFYLPTTVKHIFITQYLMQRRLKLYKIHTEALVYIKNNTTNGKHEGY